VRNPRRSLLALACLGFTVQGVAWADPPHKADFYVEDPMAPHVTNGNTARLGTAVGYVYNERLADVFAMGLTAAIGQRWGRLNIEAEYTYLQYQVAGPSTAQLGDGNRIGAIGRFDVIRLGSEVVGGNSMLAIYVEGGAGVAWNRWLRPQGGEPSRIVPDDSKRVEALTGFGIQIDHRLQEPIGFPHRIAWFLGWRIGMSPHDPEPASICRGVDCRPAPMMQERFIDRSMLFQSSLMFTW
jgi:hypothetical protein